MGFKVADKVRFLHEKGGGIITSIVSPHKVRVELTEGLEIEVPMSELVPVKGMRLQDSMITPKDNPSIKPRKVISRPHASDAVEVDLHIEEIMEDSPLMTNAQKLTIQLNYFQDALDRAIKGHVRKIIFIHGVGNGVLRQAVRDILKRYEGVEYSDGSYRKYGAGATEVRIIERKRAR